MKPLRVDIGHIARAPYWYWAARSNNGTLLAQGGMSWNPTATRRAWLRFAKRCRLEKGKDWEWED